MSAQKDRYAHHSDYPFIIITNDTVDQLPAFSDEEFYASSQGVIFQVNRTVIPSDDRFMQIYRDSVIPMINDSRLQLRKVFVRGAASPEGSYAGNQRLGRGRSEALLAALRRHLFYQYKETDAEISCITEDYAYLCLLMKQAADVDYDKVQRIYDECGGDELSCKRRLMADGPLWHRLLKDYFPQLRAARLILWFSEPDEQHAAVPKMPKSTWQLPNLDQRLSVALPEMAPLAVTPVAANRTRRHMIAVRTNLLHDFFYMPGVGWSPSPNLQFEYYPLKGHLTYNIGMTWGTHRKWNSQEFFQIRDFQAEVRRYFRGGGVFMGAYLGAFIEGNVYGIGLDKKKGWEGEGGGAGLSLGYVMPLNRKKSLRLELMVAAGVYLTYYDPYVYGNPITGTENGKYYYNYLGTASKFKKRNHSTLWIGPLNLGVQLTYDIIYRKRK